MKAVIADVPAHLIKERRRTGADRWDEMWDGVLHMPPAPICDHQDFEHELHAWIRSHWAKPHGNRVHHGVNVAAPGRWPDNYRIPDLVLLKPERFHINQNLYFDGGPNVVVEIHSPGDEAYEKLPFYAGIGVEEAWIIHRDSRVPEIHVPSAEEMGRAPASEDGWLRSEATGVWLRQSPDERLSIRLGSDEATLKQIPE